MKNLKFKKEEERFLKDIEEIRDYPEQVEAFIIENSGEYFPMIPDGTHKMRMLRKIYRNFLNEDPDKGNHIVGITDREIEFLQGLPTELIKRLFYSLIVRSKVKPHPSGWISMDFENTVLYAFSEQDARRLKIEAFSQCSDYGFETLVIGSTKPVLCFRVPVEGGEVVMEFKDGEAREKFREVIEYDTDRQDR